MPQESSDAVLGNQGAQDFAALTSPSQGSGQAASTQQGSGGETQTARNDSQGNIPRKSVDQSPASQEQDGGQGQQGQQQQQQTDQTQQGQGQTAPQNTQQQAATTQSRDDVIKAAIDAAAQTVAATRKAELQAQQQQQTAAANTPKSIDQLSPDEFNQRFGVIQVTPEAVTAILDQDPKKGAVALNNLIQGAVKQAVLMATEVANARVDKLQHDFHPHIDSWSKYHKEVREKAAEDRFFTANPDLKAERDVVMEFKDAVLAKVQSGQLRFANEAEAFSAVANGVRTMLTKYGWKPGQGNASTGTGQQAQSTGQQQTNGRQMSAASSAGRSGTGQAAAKSDVDQIFGEYAR